MHARKGFAHFSEAAPAMCARRKLLWRRREDCANPYGRSISEHSRTLPQICLVDRGMPEMHSRKGFTHFFGSSTSNVRATQAPQAALAQT